LQDVIGPQNTTAGIQERNSVWKMIKDRWSHEETSNGFWGCRDLPSEYDSSNRLAGYHCNEISR
jgi:hypothetical protein